MNSQKTGGSLKLSIQEDLLNFLKNKTGENPICREIVNEIEQPKDRYRRNDKKHFSDGINYLGFSSESPHLISYLTSDRIERITHEEGDVWEKKGRYQARAGKVIRKLFTPFGLGQFSDKDVEHFSNLFKSFSDTASGKHYFRLVEGEEIRKYYHEDTYSTVYGSKGMLWSSCMRHGSCQEYFDIYTENIDLVSMLVMFDKGDKVLGRALLWSGIEINGESRDLLDRIYTVRDSDVEAFKDYARERDWVYKRLQGYNDKCGFTDRGEDCHYSLAVELFNSSFDEYPYLDTFTYMTGDCLSNMDCDAEYTLEDTCGGRESGQVYDEYNRQYIDEDEAVFCEHSGGHCHRDDACYLTYTLQYAYPDDCKWSAIEGRYVLDADAVELANGAYVHTDNACYSSITGESYLEDDCIWSDYHDTYIPICDAVELENNEWVMPYDENEARKYFGLNNEAEEVEKIDLAA